MRIGSPAWREFGWELIRRHLREVPPEEWDIGWLSEMAARFGIPRPRPGVTGPEGILGWLAENNQAIETALGAASALGTAAEVSGFELGALLAGSPALEAPAASGGAGAALGPAAGVGVGVGAVIALGSYAYTQRSRGVASDEARHARRDAAAAALEALQQRLLLSEPGPADAPPGPAAPNEPLTEPDVPALPALALYVYALSRTRR